MCRSIQDRELLLQRCKDTAQDRRGYMMVLDDEDIEELVRVYDEDPAAVFNGLKHQWELMIN
ncbi:hypothetical protein D3C77_693530 [compost metagenome]